MWCRKHSSSAMCDQAIEVNEKTWRYIGGVDELSEMESGDRENVGGQIW